FFNACRFSLSIYNANMSMLNVHQLNPFHFWQRKVFEEEKKCIENVAVGGTLYKFICWRHEADQLEKSQIQIPSLFHLPDLCS
ncbi:MAG: hypothetical protein KAR17_05060, partial [Cyclobacteriaceae bacterium]|nr:hypothetical protein [Cyclobacteriaceae bacterium]